MRHDAHLLLRSWGAALERTSAHVRSHLHPVPEARWGLFAHSQVRGRQLETSLALHLLQREGVEPQWQQRLRACLKQNLTGGDGFSQLLANQVLGLEPCTSARFALEGLLKDLQYGTSRKRHLLQVLLLEVGLRSGGEELLETLPATHPSWHLFSRIYAAASRLILHRRLGRTVTGLPEVAFLRDTQGANGGWEQQALLTLVALLGLGQEQPECFARGLRFLQHLSRPDGGIPFIDNLNIWVSALSGLALREVRGAPPSMLMDLGAYLAAHQSEEGGWSFTENVAQNDTDTTAQCVMLLQDLGLPRHATALSRGHYYLLRLQRPDGGYPTYVGDADSEVTMTACILQAQGQRLREDPSLAGPIQRGLSYLVDHQQADGTFERSWSLCETYSLFRVVWALESCQPYASGSQGTALRQGALRYLLASQQENGRWGQTANEPGDVLSTAYAASALSMLGHRERLPSALSYLLSQQSPEGAIVSRPDQSGPRPFVYDEPLLGSIFSIIALAWARRLLGAHARDVRRTA
ncbi:terpene cyclase/mutase family protein [Archangium sp.]|uniref:prenyltransferase/squalene oxidase repeat-containing protein n=1 Tax=Archangium sp. TaxID=1872627 RepID=UPI00286A7CA2|nr:terpene cyclase/mutase family protein [Archangium sp.]